MTLHSCRGLRNGTNTVDLYNWEFDDYFLLPRYSHEYRCIVSRWPGRVFQRRHINRSSGHLLVWNDSSASQEALGCAKARDASSSNKAYSGLGDGIVQQPMTEKLWIWMISAKVSCSPSIHDGDLWPYTTVCAPIVSCYSALPTDSLTFFVFCSRSC